jgi:hypothetical protein
MQASCTIKLKKNIKDTPCTFLIILLHNRLTTRCNLKFFTHAHVSALDLAEAYWCVYDQSLNVPNSTWFVSYSHLTYSDVDISRCRHVAFVYSAAIFFERKLPIFVL